MSTDYRVEMQQEEKLREIMEKQVDALVKVSIPEEDAYEMLEAWHLKNGYPFITTDLKVFKTCNLTKYIPTIAVRRIIRIVLKAPIWPPICIKRYISIRGTNKIISKSVFICH